MLTGRLIVIGDEMKRKVDGGCDPSTKLPNIQGCFPPCGPNMICVGEMYVSV